MRTYTTKVGRKTCTFYCQTHGKPCLVQSKYVSAPGGTCLIYQSNDEHDDNLGRPMTGLLESVKSTICELMESGHFTLKILVDKLQEMMKDELLPPLSQINNQERSRPTP